MAIARYTARLLNTLKEVSTLLQALTVAWILNGPLNRLSEPNVIDLRRKFSEDALAMVSLCRL